MKYLSSDEIIEINKIVTRLSGGSAGLRDAGLLASIVVKPRTSFGGVDMYPDNYLKAGILFEAIVNYHVFVDGNKRTAFASMVRFLAINEYSMDVTDREIVDFTILVATKKLDMTEIANWVKAHTKKI